MTIILMPSFSGAGVGGPYPDPPKELYEHLPEDDVFLWVYRDRSDFMFRWNSKFYIRTWSGANPVSGTFNCGITKRGTIRGSRRMLQMLTNPEGDVVPVRKKER